METETNEPKSEGWAYPTLQARKAHYFQGEGLRSLCGRYALVWGRERLQDDTGKVNDEDCAACSRKLRAR